MNCELVSIGTELLLGQIIDTNAAYIAGILAELGISVYYKSTVGDNPGRIREVIGNALNRSDLVICTGGLGPTLDDLTMALAAEAMGAELIRDPEVEGDIRSFFDKRRQPMADNNLKQALVPKGAGVIRNQVGTAPGIILEKGGKTIICMPGVPSEMRWMMENRVIPYLAERVRAAGGSVIKSKVIKIFGIGESSVEERVKDILLRQGNPTVAPLASNMEVKLRVTAKAPTEEDAKALIEPVVSKLAERLGDAVFGFDDDTMETAVGGLLRERGMTVALAESCTGGLIAKRLTDVAGSSEYVDRGFVTYSNHAKTELLGVPAELINQYGAVSSQVALAMAEGAREQAGVDAAVSVTGIAGPGGGTREKPVGLVYIGLSSASGTVYEEHRFIGGRETIRNRTSQAALDLLRRHLLSLR